MCFKIFQFRISKFVFVKQYYHLFGNIKINYGIILTILYIIFLRGK